MGLEGAEQEGVGRTGGDSGDELGGDSASEDLLQGFGEVGLQADGEGLVFADLVLHGAEGFVEGVDDEVAGSGAEGGVGEFGIFFDGEADGSGDVGGEGEGCAFVVQAKVDDEGAAPVSLRVGAEEMEQGEGAQGAELGGVFQHCCSQA